MEIVLEFHKLVLFVPTGGDFCNRWILNIESVVRKSKMPRKRIKDFDIIRSPFRVFIPEITVIIGYFEQYSVSQITKLPSSDSKR